MKLRAPQGAGTRADIPTQQKMLKKLKEEVGKHRFWGTEIIQIDESTFNPNALSPTAWAPKGKPFHKPGRFSGIKYLAVVAAISDKVGAVMRASKVNAEAKG